MYRKTEMVERRVPVQRPVAVELVGVDLRKAALSWSAAAVRRVWAPVRHQHQASRKDIEVVRQLLWL